MHACIVCVCSRSSNQNIRTAPALEVRTRRVRTQRAENPTAIFTSELRSHGRSESSDLCSRYECCSCYTARLGIGRMQTQRMYGDNVCPKTRGFYS